MTGSSTILTRCRFGARRLLSILALGAALSLAPAHAGEASADLTEIRSTFDSVLGTELRGPPTYSTAFERQLASVAEASRGRIGVAAVDLASGRTIGVLDDQRFPMASTSKIAIAATFMAGVEQGKWSLSSEFPMLVPVKSTPFSSAVAPVRPGAYMTARELIEQMITRSNNYATDGLLKVVGGPKAVNDWVHNVAGVKEWSLDRDIATLVRDDGALDPAKVVDTRDSATPLAMVQLLAGIYKGQWLRPESRDVILGAMSRCRTGRHRIPAGMPEGVTVSHKTGSLNNTSSDVGIVETPDGRTFAVAIYVTGQGSRPNRETRIAQIARAVYDGYLTESSSYLRTASR